MNKSKFLKKSLAMLLAIMMVVAMIPLSASAATVDNTLVSLEVAGGTLTGSNKTWTNTVPYNVWHTADDTVTFIVNAAYDTVKYDMGEDEWVTATGYGNVYTLTQSADLTLYIYKSSDTSVTGPETVKDVYTVKLVKTPASSDTTIKSAKLDGTYVGAVDNTKRTITFTVPWGYFAANGPSTMVVTPNANAAVTESNFFAAAYVYGTAQSYTSEAEDGASRSYSVVANQKPGLSTFTIGGVAAVEDEDHEGEYLVKLPYGTKTTELPIVFASATTIKSATFAGTAVKSGTSYNLSSDGTGHLDAINADGTGNKVNLVVTAADDGVLTIPVTVSVLPNSDAAITAFTATDAATDDYTEEGVVKGDQLTVTLPVGSELTSVNLEFTTAGVVSIPAQSSLVGSAGTGTYSLAAANLTKPVTVQVTAADGTTVKYYTLTATAAEAVVKNPAITAGKMTIGSGATAKEYTATISASAKTITFTVPYSTLPTAIWDGTDVKASFVWAKTPATYIYDIDWEAAADKDIFSGTNEVTVESDGESYVTYTIIFKKDAAKKTSTLTSWSFTTADEPDDMDKDNTFKANVKTGSATVTLPHTPATVAGTVLHDTIEIPEGAAVYFTTDGDALTAYGDAGWDADGEAWNVSAFVNTQDAKDLYDLSEAKKDDKKLQLVVMNEIAAYAAATAGTPVAMEDLTKTPYRGNVSTYVVTIAKADASSAAALISIKDEDEFITSKVSGTTAVTVTVPYLATTGYGALEIEASPYATVKLYKENGDEITVDPNKYSFTNGATPTMENDDTVVATIKVTSEDGSVTNSYKVTVVVKPAETGALLTSLKVNGVAAVINNNDKTAKVTLKNGADLTAVTMEGTVSTMAIGVVYEGVTQVIGGVGKFATDATDDPDVIADSVDLTADVTITVWSEDDKTMNTYTVTAAEAELSFKDVKEGKWYYEEVMKAAEMGIVTGNTDGTFKPDNNVTRQDFVAMTVRMLGLEETAKAMYTTTPFTDVKDAYAIPAVAYAAANGWVSGRGSAGTFDPKAPITRQEAVKILCEALKKTSSATKTAFADNAEIATWAIPYVAAATDAKLVNGYGTGATATFKPTKNISRAEAAAILVRASK